MSAQTSPTREATPSTLSVNEVPGAGPVRDRDVTCKVAPPPARYPGQGTQQDPYIVDWDEGDPENPYNWSKTRRWIITAQLALGTWTVSFCSSAYSGGIEYTEQEFRISEVGAVQGVSLYVLGFGLGPLLFAPLSETFGRRPVFLCTMTIFTLFHLGGALGHRLSVLLVTRLLAGIFGSSPLSNAGGAIADIWNARDRGFATALYTTAPWLGPVVGPIVGGFVSQSHLTWHFVFWIMMIASGASLLAGFLVTPETYAPVLLNRRARKLRRESGGAVIYKSKYDIHRTKSFLERMKISLGRPFLFLFTEPIVAALAVYITITYSTLYAFFAAFPIVFQQHRHFSAGYGGLAFLGIGVGNIIGTCTTPIQTRLYWRAMARSPSGIAPPEARLYGAIFGSTLLPISLFWFGWTTYPSVHWIFPILAGIPFGTGAAQVFQSCSAYLMDTYQIYFASAIAATIVTRSLGAFAFPLFSPAMFDALGDQWACSVFGFLALVCTPLPSIFYKYGWWIRSKSKYAHKEDSRDCLGVSTTMPLEPGEKDGKNIERDVEGGNEKK